MTWDDFNDACVSASTGSHNRGCGVGRLYDRLAETEPKEAVESIERAMTNPHVTTSGIHNELIKRLGDKVPSRSTVTRHRKRECNCKGDA